MQTCEWATPATPVPVPASEADTVEWPWEQEQEEEDEDEDAYDPRICVFVDDQEYGRSRVAMAATNGFEAAWNAMESVVATHGVKTDFHGTLRLVRACVSALTMVSTEKQRRALQLLDAAACRETLRQKQTPLTLAAILRVAGDDVFAAVEELRAAHQHTST